MRWFLVQHIDSLSTIAIGVAFWWLGYAAGRPGKWSRFQRRARLFQIASPVLVVCGLAQFFIVERDWIPAWRPYASTDGVASAEFPGVPQSEENTVTANGVAILQTTLRFTVPGKDISMLLSFSPIPAAASSASDSERVAGIKAKFAEQGWTILHDSSVRLGAVTGFEVDMQRDGGKGGMWTRIAFVSRNIYRVVAASSADGQDDPTITRFLESFQIKRAD
jgi:hypothetical protein